MFRLLQGALLKKVVLCVCVDVEPDVAASSLFVACGFDDRSSAWQIFESIKDLVTEANLDCGSTGIALQAMDSSHVSLVALFLRSEVITLYAWPPELCVLVVRGLSLSCHCRLGTSVVD